MLTSLLALAATALMGANASAFSWFQLVPGFGHANEIGHALGLADAHTAFVIPTAWTVVAVLLAFAFLARRGMERALAQDGPERFIPDATLSARNVGEVLVEGVSNLVGGTLKGKDAAFFFPFLATIFLYILLTNLLGFVPGVLPSTENFSNNFAMSLCVFVVFNVAGLARNGTGYVKHLWGPKLHWALIPLNLLIFGIETFSLFLRPATLSIRLTANIFADHLVSGVVRDLGGAFPSVLSYIGAALLPLPFYALGLLVCFLQAFVFTLLSTIYVGLAVAHDEEHH
jgi:F-type H+-transporting ATPase subunit a